MTFFSNANMYKHRQRLHRTEWEADRSKPIPPNIMKQAKQGSRVVKLKRNIDEDDDIDEDNKLLIPLVPSTQMVNHPHHNQGFISNALSISYNMAMP